MSGFALAGSVASAAHNYWRSNCGTLAAGCRSCGRKAYHKEQRTGPQDETMPDDELVVAPEKLKDSFPRSAGVVVSVIRKARKASGLEQRTLEASAEVRIGSQTDCIEELGERTAATNLEQRLQTRLTAVKIVG